MFGDRELACSANLESSCSAIFGEIVLGDFWSNIFGDFRSHHFLRFLESTCSANWRNRVR